MHPFFFGSSERQLFGVHHPPRGRAARRQGVLLCYPFGFEYMRAHRAFRQLANLLSRGGAHVLRFDYFGTGDSAGDGGDATVERWVDDVGIAADELKANAGLSSVDIAGLRLGGALGALASIERDDVDRLVLWDPVVGGEKYVDQMLEGQSLERSVPPGAGGVPVTKELRRGLRSIDLREIDGDRRPRTRLVISEERPDFRHLASAWTNGRSSLEVDHVPSPNDWSEGDEFGSALLPQDMIQHLVEKLLEAR